jgi:pimeloyl-ACP methyl ester carboxylesterase
MAMPLTEARLLGCGLSLSMAISCATRGEKADKEPAHLVVEPAVSLAATPVSAVASASVAPPTTASVAVPVEPASVVSLPVDGDLPAALVKGASGPPRIVFLPGLCSNAGAYLHGFPEAARAAGGVVAIDGEKHCSPGFRSFIRNPPKQHERIQAAFKAAGLESMPAEGVTIVGYSQGASIAEDLVEKYPEIYTRVVLMGSPKDPAVQRIKGVRAAGTMSCSLDVPGRMKQGAKKLEALNVPARYFEMPGCTHGNVADGDRVFGEVFAFLASH